MKQIPLQLSKLDYSMLQQCMHCGMCLPVCPTFDATKLERHSPRGRIALMRAITDGRLGLSRAFAEEMYFCLGCLACESACPAGVDYGAMFEASRCDVESSRVLATRKRDLARWLALQILFTHPRMLRLAGHLLRHYRNSLLPKALHQLRLTRWFPSWVREFEPFCPELSLFFSDQLIKEQETPKIKKYRVGMLTGCVQDLLYAQVNRDTVDILLVHNCEVLTPRRQSCCGSLHAHNGNLKISRTLARRNIKAMERLAGSLDSLDAIISNAGGCGSHLKHYDELLKDDPAFRDRAKQWSEKLKDVSEWLKQIGIKRLPSGGEPKLVTYHESCHLCHGQKVSAAPRELLCAISDLTLIEMKESTWCCGSAGIYNLTQPEMAASLLQRKLLHLESTKATVVASANPGCTIQLEIGLRKSGRTLRVTHPVSLYAEAYRKGLNPENA